MPAFISPILRASLSPKVRTPILKFKLCVRRRCGPARGHIASRECNIEQPIAFMASSQRARFFSVTPQAVPSHSTIELAQLSTPGPLNTCISWYVSCISLPGGVLCLAIAPPRSQSMSRSGTFNISNYRSVLAAKSRPNTK